MDSQTLIHDHSLKEHPNIFWREDIGKILYAFKNSKSYRKDLVGEWIRKRDTLIFLMSYELALRPKEVLGIKFTDIDLKAKIIRIDPQNNKVRHGRNIPIPPQIENEIIDYLRTSRLQYWKFSPHLFPSLQNSRLSTDRWQEIFRDRLIEAGLRPYSEPGKRGKYTPYTLRHTKSTEVYEQTKDILVVANMLGHRWLDSSRVYVHLAAMREGYMDYMRKAMTKNI